MKWSVGDKVMAKWPGSALYFHAEIKAIDNENDSAELLYSDGTEMEVPMKFIKAEGLFTQPKRSKSPGRSRRRSRSRSPGRSPARKSRVLKKDNDKKERRSRSSSRGRKSVQSSDSDKKVVITGTAEKITSETTTTSEKVVINTTTLTQTKVNVSDTPSDGTRYMMTRQRAKVVLTDAMPSQESRKPDNASHAFEYEYGGVLGTFIMYMTIPIFPLWMLIACNKSDCSVSKFSLSMVPRKLDAYFNMRSFEIVFGFLLFQAIVYALPLGHIIKGPPAPNGKRLNYRISARYTLFLTACAYAAMYHYKVPVTSIHNDLLQLACAAAVVSYVANFLLYLWTFRIDKSELNPAGNTGSFLYDSFIGRYMNPRIGLFDLKLYLYRPAMAGWVVMIWIEMARDYELHSKYSPQLLVLAISQLVYNFLVFFFDEDQCPYMFDVKNEGLGLVQFFGELVIVPFVYSLPVRYVVDHPSNLPTPILVAAVALICTGFYLVGWSGRIKSIFRKNPYDQQVINLESLPSSKVNGDRILVSGLWGFVRHPNYLGEIFVGLGWSLACGFKHLVPWYYPIFITVLLLHRSVRDDARCRKKHGHTWKMYCERVKYRVIPGIY